jgi:hypothetical protein
MLLVRVKSPKNSKFYRYLIRLSVEESEMADYVSMLRCILNDYEYCSLGFDESIDIMEAVRTSETSVDNHFTRQYNPEDSSEHHGSLLSYGICPDN